MHWTLRTASPLFAFALLSSLISVAALEATPTTDDVCLGPPRSFEFFAALATPGNQLPAIDPAATAFEFQSAVIEPSPDDIAGIQRTAAMLIVCLNAGDVPRTNGLFTDAYWQRRVDSEQDIASFAEEYGVQDNAPDLEATPAPALVPMVLIDAKTLPDGRVAARYWYTYSDDGTRDVFLLVFALVNGRWLIDELIVSADAYIEATPHP